MAEIAKHTCPRRVENGMDRDDGPMLGGGSNLDTYEANHGLSGQPSGCSYCGSMPPGLFMQWIVEGAEVGPTDKNYKAYIDHPEGGRGKFYYQHLDDAQRVEFVRMLNAGEMAVGYPGHFYRLPFFVKPA